MPAGTRSPVRRERELAPGRTVASIGLEEAPFRDAYHLLLTMSWPRFLLLALGAWVAANALFALGYRALGDAIENADGSFGDAFFFSVQTLATIGYGRMAPRTLAANVLVSAEALVGMMGLAVATGLVYARFARPTARVLFSRRVVVAPQDGVPCLMFRMANARGNQIAEAHLHLVLLREETTAEGERMRRSHDLQLRRSESAIFALTWTAIHPIGPDSPLLGETAESLRHRQVDLVASVTGHDAGLSQTVHARHYYRAEDVVFGARLADITSTEPDGTRVVDYRRFHDVEPLEAAAARTGTDPR